MPLMHSGSKSAIGHNISAEVGAGKPRKQAIAIALSEARRSGADIPKPKTPRYRDGARLTTLKMPRVVVGD